MEKNTIQDSKKKKSLLGWVFWWQIDKDELDKQVNEYNTLKLTQSARGISLLLLLFSAIVTSVLILFFNWDVFAFFDVFLFLILGFFIYKGHRWAIIGAMLLWTYEKIFLLFEQYQNASNAGTSSPNPIVSLIWWATYMHAFYLAFQIERLRTKERMEMKLTNQITLLNNSHLDELEKLADLKNRGVITEEDFIKKKNQILGI